MNRTDTFKKGPKGQNSQHKKRPYNKGPVNKGPVNKSPYNRDSDRDHEGKGKPRDHAGRGKFGDKRPSQHEFVEREPVIYSDDPKGIAVRRAATDLLTLVKEGLSLDEALSQCRSYEGLGRTAEGDKEPSITRADKGFARAIATTVLRQRGALDHLISPYLNRPLPTKSYRVMDNLRIAGAQTLYLDTPPHAAVSLSTELCKERKETAGYANLVNAVARKLSQTPKEKIDELPVRTNTPAWLWRSWERAYGPVHTRQIAHAHTKQAPLDITFAKAADRDLFLSQIDPEFQVSIFDYNKDLLSVRLNNVPSNVTKLPGFEEGQWWVQDLSASLPVALLGDIAGKHVIDLCAAPGGKTLQLAAGGANVAAVDRSEERLQRLRRNLERTNLHADVFSKDAFDFRSNAPADIVLLDAPCSATGTIRRHPDIPWNKTQTDIDALIRVQSDMIGHALTMLKPGGTILYCTCSLQPDEGEKQIQNALNKYKDLERMPFDASADDALKGPWDKTITKDGDVRVLPSLATDQGGMDGFFISRLEKKS